MSHPLFNPAYQPLRRVMPGQRIPWFQLRTTGGQVVDSSLFLGRRVILAFLGLPADPLGQRLLRQLQASQAVLHTWGGSVVAVAPLTVDLDQFPTLPNGLTFPVLVDVSGWLHEAFGAVDWSDAPAPSVYLTDPAGTVIYRALTGLGESLPSTSTLIALLQFDQLAPDWLSSSPRPRAAGERTLRAPVPARPRSAGPTAVAAPRPGAPRRR
jgi:peroxiredoxin